MSENRVMDVTLLPPVAEGSVYDKLSDQLARAMASALEKTRVEDLTELEVVALAVMAKCQIEVVMRGGDNYQIKTVRPVEVVHDGERFLVYEREDDA